MTSTQLHFSLLVEGLAEDDLLVTQFSGEESLSAPFSYLISLSSHRDDIAFEAVVDKDATLILQHHGIQQTIYGIVKSFSIKDMGHLHTAYELELVPALARCALRHNSRIFQFKKVNDIISQLLSEMQITEFAFALKESYEPRDYCVQYRESDLQFIARICAQEGIFYYFEQGKEKRTLVFSDDNQALSLLDPAIAYNALSGGTSPHFSIRAFHYKKTLASSSATLQDYSFKKPRYHLSHHITAQAIEYQRDTYEHFDFPGEFEDDNNGLHFTRVRMAQLQNEAQMAQLKSDHIQLFSGQRFTLCDHPDDALNRNWLVVRVSHTGTQPQALEAAGTEGKTTYSNTAHVMQDHLPWRASAPPKNTVDGPQLATVVGPAQQEIHCDDYGRVKVLFPWDKAGRPTNELDQSSCWVRVSQAWAGNQYGMMSLPRVGNEVIVSFLNGDPDCPFITGSAYNAVNQPPYALPAHKSKSVWRSETHQGEGFNEISFEDQVNEEQVYIHAQKDMRVDINNDSISHINNDQHVSIDKNAFIQTKENYNLISQGEIRQHSEGAQTLSTTDSLHLKQGDSLISETDNEIHFNAGKKVVITAGAEITLQVGGNFIKADASGIYLSASQVNINSGGSAGSGSPFSGSSAALPLVTKIGLSNPLPATPVTSPLKQVINEASMATAQSFNVLTPAQCKCEVPA